ncbi:hypothetical protein Gpo141_00007172, partial [Globisporangium polare]
MSYGSFPGEKQPQTHAELVTELPRHRHVSSTRRMLAVVLASGISLILGIGYIASSVVVTTSSVPLLVGNSNSVAASTPQLASAPIQVHVALADVERLQTAGSAGHTKLGITVSWASATQTQTSTVRFGLDAANLGSIAQAETKSEQYQFCQYASPWFHHVVIPSCQLEPSTTYYYQCGDEAGGWSDVA